jgi:hypothetical protein
MPSGPWIPPPNIPIKKKAHRTLLEICEEVKRGDHFEDIGEGYVTG